MVAHRLPSSDQICPGGERGCALLGLSVPAAASPGAQQQLGAGEQDTESAPPPRPFSP